MFKFSKSVKMAELVKYFKRTQKKNKLDTDTLPDPGGPLAGIFLPILLRSHIPTCARPSATGSIK